MLDFFKNIGRLFLPFRYKNILIVGSVLIYLGFTVFFQLSVKLLVDYAITPHQKGWLLIIIASLLAGIILTLITGVVFTGFLYSGVKANIISDLNLKIYTHIQKLSMGFFQNTNSSDILSRFNTDIQAINAILIYLPMETAFLLSLLASTGLLFYLNWQLALLTVFGLPLCLVIPRILGRRAENLNYHLKDEQTDIFSIVQESIGAQIVIKAYGLQGLMLEKFRTKLKEYDQAAKEAGSTNFLIMFTTNIGVTFLNVLVFCVGSIMAYHNYLSVGALLAFNTTLINITGLINELTWLVPQVFEASASLKRIQAILDEKPAVLDESSTCLPPFADSIELNKVTFGYKPPVNVLVNVNLTIPKGSYVTFVGASGSGKSTVINLLMRFYDPASGSVSFDGHNIRQVSQDSLRAQMGIVFQENLLFDTSILENIRLGRPDASDMEVIAAARAAEIHSLIVSLPDGYNTRVGEKGGSLSGGQRQRIAIARALVRDPKILLLDEATSALDPANEAAINKTIKRLSQTRTIISVTHRLSSAKEADHIVVFDKGTVVEEGTHRELLELESSIYKNLWQSQSGFAISEDGFNAEVTSERLKDISLFQGLDDDFLDDICKLFVTEYYPDNRTVITEGEPGDKFYIIVRGKVEVVRKTGPDTQDRLSVLSDGDFFGEIALIKNVTRTASITTLMPTTLISLQRSLFHNMLEKAPGLLEKLSSHGIAGTGE
ncbi:MAG: ATP-binding cassette domain-containing protein [Deltaproteobacteria bacterium]